MPSIAKKVHELFANLGDVPRAQALVDEIYDPRAVFSDPVQTARGRKAISEMVRRLDKKMGGVTVEMLGEAKTGNQIALHWIMEFKPPFPKKTLSLPGVSWLELGEDGRCVKHTDYWDWMGLFDQILPASKPLHDLVRKFAG